MTAASAPPLRVAHLITDLDVGGAEIMLARLVEALDRRRVQSVVVSLAGRGSVARRIAASGIQVIELEMKADASSVLAFWRAVRVFRNIRPDIVHTWLYHADLIGLVAGAVAGVPAMMWNVRCSELRHPSAGIRIMLRLLAWSSRYPAAVVFNSHAGLRAHMALGYRPRRSEVIPNGLAAGDFAIPAPVRDEMRRRIGAGASQLVGLIARMDPLKDHETFLRAAAILRRARDVRFVLAGRGVVESDTTSALIRSLGLEDAVVRLPEQQNIAPLTAALDLAVSSSCSEGFPNVLIEAMACGVPCVATNAGDSALVLDDPDRIVPVRDPAALAAACLRVLRMTPEARAAIGDSERARVSRLYALDAIARQYVELYEEVAAEKKRAAVSRLPETGRP